MRRELWGALAGTLATVPMTLAMVAMHRRLPFWQRTPLPPRPVTRNLLQPVGSWQQLDEAAKKQLVAAAHLGYGAATGAVTAAGSGGKKLSPLLAGPLLGSAIWAGSYLGWLPALGVLSSAVRQPWRRNLLMLSAHWVWGIADVFLNNRLAAEADQQHAAQNDKDSELTAGDGI